MDSNLWARSLISHIMSSLSIASLVNVSCIAASPVFCIFVKSIISNHCFRVVYSVNWSLVISRRLIEDILHLVLLPCSSCASSSYGVATRLSLNLIFMRLASRSSLPGRRLPSLVARSSMVPKRAAMQQLLSLVRSWGPILRYGIVPYD